MAFRRTPIVIVAVVTLIGRCSSSRVPKQLPVHTSIAQPQQVQKNVSLAQPEKGHAGALLRQPAYGRAEMHSEKKFHLPEVKHEKEAGDGYSKGSPLYRKQQAWDAKKPKGSKAQADSLKPAKDSDKVRIYKVVEPLNMTPYVLAYLSIVACFGGYFTYVIIHSRIRHGGACGNGAACRKTDRQVERMEELQKERSESMSRSREKLPSAASLPPDPEQSTGEAQPGAEGTVSSKYGAPYESGTSTPSRSQSNLAEWGHFEEAVQNGFYFSIESDMLVDVMGLSGMSLLEMDATSGISGLPLLVALPACAIQAWFLQLVILFYMGRRVIRLTGEGGIDGGMEDPKDVPFAIIFAAIYLHFINCMNDLPFSFSILKHIGELHDKRSHLIVAMPVFMVDGLIVPFTSLIIGAFYLCTSATVSDVILNSCAVAFISNIDNWILQLNEKLNKAAAIEEGGGPEEAEGEEPVKTANGMRVYIPVNHGLVKGMSWWMCVVPIAPALFSSMIAYAGLEVLKL